VTNRGHNREVVFQDDDDHRYFLNLIDGYSQRFLLQLFHYCLMGNHFHLLVRCGARYIERNPLGLGLVTEAWE
jgi:REP element-mobilizing transposase RayT